MLPKLPNTPKILEHIIEKFKPDLLEEGSLNYFKDSKNHKKGRGFHKIKYAGHGLYYGKLGAETYLIDSNGNELTPPCKSIRRAIFGGFFADDYESIKYLSWKGNQVIDSDKNLFYELLFS